MEKCERSKMDKAMCRCNICIIERDMAKRRQEKEWEGENAEKQKKINEKNPNVLPKSTLTMTVNKEDE